MTHNQRQDNFAANHPAMYEVNGRAAKAKTLLRVLRDVDLVASESVALNVGCSTAIMDRHIEPHFSAYVGVDIDFSALKFAKAHALGENSLWAQADGINLPFKSNTFGVVICSQVYEHVTDPNAMMAEIFRVLRPGGYCYFAATNKYSVIEQHYFIPFLSWLPKKISHKYLQLLNKGTYYYENHLSYFELKKLVSDFVVIDYTSKLIEKDSAYHTSYLFNGHFRSLKRQIARLLAKRFNFAMPGFVWLLKKPGEDGRK